MELKELLKYYTAHPSVTGLCEKINETAGSKILLSGLSGSASSVVFAAAYELNPFSAIAVLNDREEAAYFFDDLNALGLGEKVLFFPSSYRRSIVHEVIDSENIIFRTEVLNKLALNETGYLVITYPEAIMEKVISGSGLEKNTLHIRKGEKLSISFINEVLDRKSVV